MPKFYFDVTGNGVPAADDEGEDMADLATAEREAVATAARIACDRFVDESSPPVIIEVRDEGGQQSLVVVSLTVVRRNARLT